MQRCNMDSVRTGALHFSMVPNKGGGCFGAFFSLRVEEGKGKEKSRSDFPISCSNQLEAAWDAKQ